jgi:hypothetical protein
MKALQITLFIIGNVLFFSQLGRNFHQIVWGVEKSVLDQFKPAQVNARTSQSLETLLADYSKADAETDALEKGKTTDEIELIRRDHKSLYERHNESLSEIQERERRSIELRDLWAYSGYGLLLIIFGGAALRIGQAWVGIALGLSGFTILEYWACPPLFSGAYNEFQALLWSKTALTVLAIVLLYSAGAVLSKINRASP